MVEDVCSTLQIEPAAAIFVGDNWFSDIVGAIRAGLTPVWIRGGKASADLGHLVAEFSTLAEFDAYCARVPRLVPDFRGFGASIAGQAFQWKRVINKEYGTLAATGVALVAARMWTLHEILGPAACPALQVWAFALAPIALFYLAARVMKKTGKLAEPPAETGE